MTRHQATDDDFIDDEYGAKLDEFVADHPSVTRSDAERAFVTQCEAFLDVMKADTPLVQVRRLAFKQLEWRPPTPDTPAPSERRTPTDHEPEPSGGSRDEDG